MDSLTSWFSCWVSCSFKADNSPQRLGFRKWKTGGSFIAVVYTNQMQQISSKNDWYIQVLRWWTRLSKITPKKWGGQKLNIQYIHLFFIVFPSLDIFIICMVKVWRETFFYTSSPPSLSITKNANEKHANVLLISFHQRADESAGLLPLNLPFHRSDYPNRCAPLCWSPESIRPRRPPLISTPTNTSWRSLPGAPPGWRKASEIISQHRSHQSRKAASKLYIYIYLYDTYI